MMKDASTFFNIANENLLIVKMCEIVNKKGYLYDFLKLRCKFCNNLCIFAR